MRIKTYLSAEEQWRRTAELVCNLNDVYPAFDDPKCVGDNWHLGEIVQSHHLFQVGDMVAVFMSNGAACRQPVFAFSSKGFEINGLYLKHGVLCDNGSFDRGPLRYVEVPENLVGAQPDSPPLRRFIVALARERRRTPGKRE